MRQYDTTNENAQAHVESKASEIRPVSVVVKRFSLRLSPSPIERAAPQQSSCGPRRTSFVSWASSSRCRCCSSLSPSPIVLAEQPRFLLYRPPTSRPGFLSFFHMLRQKP